MFAENDNEKIHRHLLSCETTKRCRQYMIFGKKNEVRRAYSEWQHCLNRKKYKHCMYVIE